MHVIRFNNQSTGMNAEALISMLKDAKCEEVCLYATESKTSANPEAIECNSENLPLMAAIATYKIPCVGEIIVLFDGVFLTAARWPRYTEVRAVLDEAQQSKKTKFCTKPVSFTSALDPYKAVQSLKDHGCLIDFSAKTRPQFFSMLSNLTEAQYEHFTHA